MFAKSRLIFQHHELTESTQDLAKEEITKLESPKNILTITASEQTKGRGTSGRSWTSLGGNVIMTVALAQDEIPVTLTLLPLQVGVLVAERIDKILRDACGSEEGKVKVKWPNDVLLNDKKIAGILIESKVVNGLTWYLIGIGVNLLATPDVPSEGSNRGRQATCLQDHCPDYELPNLTAQVFSQDLTEGLVQWLERPSSTSEKVREVWKEWAEMGKPQIIRETNEVVIPLDIKEYGQLLVRGEDGKTRELLIDYLL